MSVKHRGSRSTSSALALLALACLAAPAAAQEPEPDMVPIEFVRTLAAGPFGGNAPLEIRVGRLPDDVADLIQVPAGARVVGSLINRGFSTSALAVPGDPPAARDDWTARLLDAGWARFQEASRGGFESNPTDGLQFCMGDSVTLSLGVSRNPAGGSYVHVMHPRTRMYSACQHRQATMHHGTESPIPSLSPPDNSAARGSSGGGGSDRWEADARIRTDHDVDALIDHYGAQLRDHGWTPLERTTGEGIAAETFRVTGPEGGEWHAVLTAAAPAEGPQRFLSIRVTRLERRR